MLASVYSHAAIPARIAIERGMWIEAAQLDDPEKSSFSFCGADAYFARALGAARSGNPEAAEKDLVRLREITDQLKAAKNDYWATEVEVQRATAEAWIAFAKGQREQALSLMRVAADMEDKSENLSERSASPVAALAAWRFVLTDSCHSLTRVIGCGEGRLSTR